MIKASIAATADEDESEQSSEDDEEEEDDVNYCTYSRMKRWKWTKL
jgi:hypothetical protein